MRTLSTFVSLLLSLGFLACKPSDTVSPETLTGVWIESSTRRDTVIFNPLYQGTPLPNTLRVDRGKELNSSGSLLPKIGSGLYQYELQGDTILVQSLLSSSSKRTGYRIELQDSKLRLENFFELGFNQPATATRTLVRL
ncbi:MULTISPECIES: hypothetical protein [unclassified Spirosoma]|uniref:hypothetical protein n=1 Tax=unclassified Spirosoma TaxID=2621999 RepID=UPI000964E84D|nr:MULTISPECIES: hypothetical protein [unclassified Spirosoma]MBN8821142.1 hypothetical protein [Spirosoma sp.]OJW79226.1 MAG: hypothetical protein BGO59_11815 [Spirosoma sp. 48-14]